MTRIEGGGMLPRVDWETPEEVIGASIKSLQGRLRDHRLSIQIDPSVTWAPFDSLLLEIVLRNLLDNAAKYSPPGSEISLSVFTTPTEIHWRICDQGQGFQPGEEEKIFEKFYRGRSLPPRSSGVGLGLAICKAILLAHKGRIWAERRPPPHTGLCIGLALPLQSPHLPGSSAPPWLEISEDGALKEKPPPETPPPSGSPLSSEVGRR